MGESPVRPGIFQARPLVVVTPQMSPAALMPLQEQVTAAAVFYPTDAACGVNAAGTAPHIGFMSGADFLTAWDAFGVANMTLRFDVGFRLDDTDELGPEFYMGAGQSF